MVPPSRGPGVPADLARDAAQAPGLRRLGAAQDQAPLRDPLGRAGAQLAVRRVAEPLLDADPAVGLPAARRDDRDRISPCRRAGTAGPRRGRPAVARTPRDPRGRAHRALCPDLPRPGHRPPRALPARPAPGHRAPARGGLRRHGDPVSQAPLCDRPGARDRRRLRARRIRLPRRDRDPARGRRVGYRLLVDDVRLRQHRPADAFLHLRPRHLPRRGPRLLLRLPRARAGSPARNERSGGRGAAGPRCRPRAVRAALRRLRGAVLRARRRRRRRTGGGPRLRSGIKFGAHKTLVRHCPGGLAPERGRRERGSQLRKRSGMAQKSAPTIDESLEEVVRALAAACEGDFSVRLPARRRDVVGELQGRVNELVGQNRRMAKELARVARVIGRDGRMTERAVLPGLYGEWADSIESVNALIDDLVRPTTEVARVITAVAAGDLSQKMALTIEGQPVRGEFHRIGTTVNAMVDQLSSFADETTRVAREVGTEGKLGGQARVKGVSGTWRDLTDSVNVMASNLTDQVRQIAAVTTAVAEGVLSQKVTVEAKGEVAALARTINAMVDRLSSFADEVTRVAREVGTEGELGGQAQVDDVSGTWRDLTDSVNVMASNLTDQVRQIASVTKAVAGGDLSQKVTVEAKGEVAALAETINSMTDTLRLFAEQVTGVAREVGTLGVLGGQADVPGVSGTWRDLTENVNFMAANLTDQVRNIAQVTTAVANGDLSQQITVDAQGEILELKKTINTMTDTLSR